jgi:hypothetical protein
LLPQGAAGGSIRSVTIEAALRSSCATGPATSTSSALHRSAALHRRRRGFAAERLDQRLLAGRRQLLACTAVMTRSVTVLPSITALHRASTQAYAAVGRFVADSLSVGWFYSGLDLPCAGHDRR